MTSTTLTPALSRARRLAAGSIAAFALAASAAVVSAAPADARPAGNGRDGASGPVMLHADYVPSRGERVMRVARSKAGAPYRYGATGPRAFDCSGYTQWVYRHVGKRIPRTSSAQAGAVRHISRRAARAGDLVFFTDGGSVYHVGIYDGHGAVWHAPYSGQRVHRERIWTSSIFFGRVR